MKRGVIMLPHINLRPSARRAQAILPSSILLRRAAVYWDTIEVPCNDIVDWAMPPTTEVAELRAAGVMREEIVYTPKPFGVPPGVPRITPIPGEDVSAFLVRTQWALFQHRESQEPESWTIGQEGSELVVAVPESNPAITAEVELHNLLPVPRETVPIADILAFKQKREAELVALRAELDDLCDRIATAQQQTRIKEAVELRVRNAVTDLYWSMNETFPTQLASRVSIDVSLGSVLSLVSTMILGPALGPVGIAGALVMAAASSVNIKSGKGSAPKGLGSHRGFAYVHDVLKELL